MNALLRSRSAKVIAALVILNEIRGIAVAGSIVWMWFK